MFHLAATGRAFVGDVLFVGGFGRSDFPCGDHVTLIASIQQRLWPMGATTVPIPGQGPELALPRNGIASSVCTQLEIPQNAAKRAFADECWEAGMVLSQ